MQNTEPSLALMDGFMLQQKLTLHGFVATCFGTPRCADRLAPLSNV